MTTRAINSHGPSEEEEHIPLVRSRRFFPRWDSRDEEHGDTLLQFISFFVERVEEMYGDMDPMHEGLVFDLYVTDDPDPLAD